MLDQAYHVLAEANLRVTSQRKAILEILYKCRGHHLEAEHIYQILTSGNRTKKMGLATVYRTMELFEKLGLVSRLSMENSPARYEMVIRDKVMHHHLICLRCGKLEELEDGMTEEFKERIVEDKGFMVADKPMKIYGYCGNCKRQVL